MWLNREGIPVHTGYAVEDLKTMPLGPWPRLGGLGAYVRLIGAEDATGMYVCEIPPGGQLAPERHLYEEVIYCLTGNGRTEYWRDGEPKLSLEWTGGALFASPLNVWHQFTNLSTDQPARFMAVTSAPDAFKLYRNPDFILDCDFDFVERYRYDESYFSPEPRVVRVERSENVYQHMYRNNFIPSLEEMELEVMPTAISRGEGLRNRRLLMAGNTLATFAQDYPSGTYTKAHAHDPGFQVYIASGTGFTLMWPAESGIHPYLDGKDDTVVRIDFRPGTVLVPPKGWFHQHFNPGPEPVLYVPTGPGTGRPTSKEAMAWLISVAEGGTQIDYHLEDPQIREVFEMALREHGTPDAMQAAYAVG
jgi:quercetin dioxygenase-like cupin family protein